MSLALIVLLPHVLGPTPVGQAGKEGASEQQGLKVCIGGPLILQKEPFLPNAKLAARETEDNRAKAAIEWTVNLGVQRF
jgi:hypothetical protein